MRVNFSGVSARSMFGENAKNMNVFSAIWQRHRYQRSAVALWVEVEHNWELYHVMDQTERLYLLKDHVWQKVARHQDFFSFLPLDLTAYAKAVQEFNQAMQELKTYETWYASDLNHRNRQTAAVLQGYREKVQALLRGLQPVTEDARRLLQRSLTERKILRHAATS